MTLFELSLKGYNEACEYLKSIDEWDSVSHSISTADGYSIVHYANSIIERKMNE